MGQMTRCNEGHFFDAAQHTRCPFCGVGPIDPGLTHKYEKKGPGAADAPRATGDGDKTRMYRPGETAGTPAREPQSADELDPEKTIAVWSRSGIDPVVGWLVCNEGANQGRDYRIRSGYNVIGRDTKNQICIAGDEAISRENHARIFYDPKDASFHVIAGEGRSGVYVNGRAVLQPAALKAYDILEIGASKLVFVPLCGERFRWDLVAPSADAKPGQDRSQRSPDNPGPA
jgi:hypothetical protein